MKTNKFLIAALVLLACGRCMQAFATLNIKPAVDAIYDIRAWDLAGNQCASEPYNTVTTAAKNGEVAFVLRLINPADKANWRLVNLTALPDEVAAVLPLYKPTIGLVMNRPDGDLAYGDLGPGLQTGAFTYFIVKYSIQQGDLALPLSLPSPIYFGTPSKSTDCWQLLADEVVDSGATTNRYPAHLVYSTDTGLPAYGPDSLPRKGSNVDLTDAGIYIDTLSDSLDRDTIPQNGERSPTLSFLGAPAGGSVLYAWSSDETVFSVDKGTATTILLDDNTSKTVKVLAIDVVANQQNYAIKLKAATSAVKPATADLCISHTLGCLANGVGTAKTVTKHFPITIGDPEKPTISVDFTPLAIEAGPDYKSNYYEGVVKLNQPYTNSSDVVVTLAPTSAVAAVNADITNYVRIASSPKNGYKNTEPVTLTFTAGQLEQSFYVFAMGADANTYGLNEICLAVTNVADAAVSGFFSEREYDAVELVPAAPTVTVDELDTDPVVGESTSFNIHVSDSFKNSQTSGYQVKFRRKKGAKQETLGTSWKIKDSVNGNCLVATSDGVTLPSYTYDSAGTETNLVTVVSPSGQETTVELIVNINAANTPYIVITDDKKTVLMDSEVDAYGEIEESTKAYKVQIKLSEPSSETVYAFLAPADGDPNVTNYVYAAFMTNNPSATGIEIKKGQQASTSKTANLYILDGKDGENEYNFNIVFCTSKTYNPANLASGFNSGDEITIAAVNAEPKLTNIKIDGITKSASSKIDSSDTPRALTLTVNDVTADLTATNSAGVGTFHTKVLITNNIGSAYDEFDYYGDPALFTTNYVFTSLDAGNVTRYFIHVELQDKDMEADEVAAFDYTLEVNSNPTLAITGVYAAYDESLAVESTGSIDETAFALTIDGDASKVNQEITVRLTLVNTLGGANDGNVILGGAGIEAWGVTNTATSAIGKLPSTPTNCNDVAYYKVKLNPKTGLSSAKLYLTRLDGTLNPVLWQIQASNETAAVQCNAGVSTSFTVANVDPSFRCLSLPDDTSKTNAVTAAIGTREVAYYVGDVADDCAGKIKVEWSDGANKITDNITSNGYYTATLKFTQSGPVTYTVTVTDKDYGQVSHDYYFDVTPTKMVQLRPINPQQKSSNSALGQSFAAMDGLGYGGVKVDNAILSGISGTGVQTWTTGAGATALKVYALGWNTDYNAIVTNGTEHLNAYSTNLSLVAEAEMTYDEAETFRKRIRDMEADEKINLVIDQQDLSHFLQRTSYQKFSGNGVMESFFYGYILESPDSDYLNWEGSAVVKAPAGRYNIADSEYNIVLPATEKDATSYEDRYATVVFAKEYRVKDNMGDINKDGIPDYYAAKYKLYEDGLDYDTTTSMAGDNRDGDFLPVQMWTGGPVTPGATNSWSTPFTAKLEIRGHGEGLNAGYKLSGISTPDLSELEFLSARMQWLNDLEENRATYHLFTSNEVAELEFTDNALFKKLFTQGKSTPPNYSNHWNSATATVDPSQWFEYYVTKEFQNAYLLAPDKEIIAKFGPDGTGQTGIGKYYLGELYLTLDGWIAGSGWTPENPTDPTSNDTDGDGLDDGYEYFLWYAAQVGYLKSDAASGQQYVERLSGRKMSSVTGENGSSISPADIVQTFNPTVSSGSARNGDLDNDGLSNIEEILAGTNPVDWDTDGDGLPDYWEVSVAQTNPLAASGGNNSDGDYMAYETLDAWTVFDTETLSVNTNKSVYASDVFEYAATPKIVPYAVKVVRDEPATNIVVIDTASGAAVTNIYTTIFNNTNGIPEFTLVDLPLVQTVAYDGSNTTVAVEWYVVKAIIGGDSPSTNYYLTTEKPKTERLVKLARGSHNVLVQDEKDGEDLYMQAIDERTGYPLWQETKDGDKKTRLYTWWDSTSTLVTNDWATWRADSANALYPYPDVTNMVASTYQGSNTVYALQFDSYYNSHPSSDGITPVERRDPEFTNAVPRLKTTLDKTLLAQDVSAYSLVPIREYVLTNLNAEAQATNTDPTVVIEDKWQRVKDSNNADTLADIAAIRGKRLTLKGGTVVSSIVRLEDLVDTLGTNIFPKGVGDLRLRIGEHSMTNGSEGAVDGLYTVSYMSNLRRWGGENDVAVPASSSGAAAEQKWPNYYTDALDPFNITTNAVTLQEETNTVNNSFNANGGLYLRIVGHAGTANIYYANTNSYPEAVSTNKYTAMMSYSASTKLALVHRQVYAREGFDPRTGWGIDSFGYLGERWRLPANQSQCGEAGKSVNTKAFTDKDEYLTMLYLYNIETFDRTKTNPDTHLGEDDDLSVMQRMRKRTTRPNITQYAHGADTDGDGMADGWELYVGLNPLDASDAEYDYEDLGNNLHGDSLTAVAEFLGTDVAVMYGMANPAYTNSVESGNICRTIVDNWDPQWLNKFFPTDPFDKDTDGDGILDGNELNGAESTQVYINRSPVSEAEIATSFLYGEPKDDLSLCIRGGGLNPDSVDTDGDLLPDTWEAEHAGIIVDTAGNPAGVSAAGFMLNSLERMHVCRQNGITLMTNETDVVTNDLFITHGMDGTYGNDARTVLGAKQRDPRTNTYRDVDWDGDGLQNYQEYYVQALRCFRYDLLSYYYGLMQGTIFDPTVESPYASDGVVDNFQAGLFVPPPHDWDLAACTAKATGKARFFMFKPGAWTGDGGWLSLKGLTYVGCDPRLYDTDGDGMDDYYELFHGLNPIAGGTPGSGQGRDVIYESYLAGHNVTPQLNSGDPARYPNLAHNEHYGSRQLASNNWSYVDYPWLNGLPESDPDGDGLRNSTEMLVANNIAPATTHTDPSPRWMTDASSTYSITRQYYRIPAAMLEWDWFKGTSPATTYTDAVLANIVSSADAGAASGYVFAFEENEGFDTDHDVRNDNLESINSVLFASDPLDAQDPSRRQAVYFPGSQSAMMTQDGIQYRSAQSTTASGDMFRQFTVEAWVCPDTAKDGVILERIAVYPRNALSQGLTNGWPRANFRLGIANGKFYGMYDSDTAAVSGVGLANSSMVEGSAVTPGVWKHLALSYDGQQLRIYEDGQLFRSVPTTLVPANGIRAYAQNATENWPVEGYDFYPSSLVLGAQLTVAGVEQLGLDQRTARRLTPVNFSWSSSFTGLYQGYVDEVRVWDGVRSDSDIKENYKKTLSLAEVKANRDAVASSWLAGGRRAKEGTLPAELVQNYSFSQLPGAVATANVATEPAGFDKALKETTNKDANIQWITNWLASATCDRLASTVYTSSRYLPVAVNTVDMLPPYDGSAVDTPYWSRSLAGWTLSSEAGDSVKSFDFPNSANPYGRNYIYGADHIYRWWKLNVLAVSSTLGSNLLRAYEFQLRSEFLGSGDLYPLGGTFAKRSDTMWDGQGAADAWENTVTATAPVNDNDVPAWFTGTVREYIRRLAQGLLPGAAAPDGKYSSQADADSNGIPDWWQRYYSLQGGGLDDDDNDGLSNYTEYLLSEVFAVTNQVTGLQAEFDPTCATSVDTFTLDYFFKLGSLYIGEVFTDHDQVDDLWEDLYTDKYTSRLLYDAHVDNDGDGWSARSEYLYSKLVRPIAASELQHLDITNVDSKDYPVPTVHLAVNYVQEVNNEAISDANIVVYVKNRNSLRDFDAKYVFANQSESVSSYKYLGQWSGRYAVGALAPGNVKESSIELQAADDPYDPTYRWKRTVIEWHGNASGATVHYENGKRADYEEALLQYGEDAVELLSMSVEYERVDDVNVIYSPDSRLATITYGGSNLGWVDLNSGEYSLNFNKLTTSELRSKWYRIAYEANPQFGYPRQLYLGDADIGAIKEGKNNMIVVADVNGDGVYTPGEPFGFVRDVDVGWYGGEAAVQLTRTSPVSVRMNLLTGENDREVVAGKWSATKEESGAETAESLGDQVRMRVVRSFCNGEPADDCTYVILDKNKYLNSEIDCFLTEADFLDRGEFDIDWTLLKEDYGKVLIPPDITNVEYKVVFGNEEISKVKNTSSNTFNSVSGRSFLREFDGDDYVSTAIAVAPTATENNTVKTAQPTFKWRLDRGDTYTCFRIVVDGATGSGFHYDSGILPAPCKDASGNYNWTAPLYVGDEVPAINGTGIYANMADYSWTVTMYNAKFRDGTKVGTGAYYLDVPERSAASGSVSAKIRYFGPTNAYDNVAVRIQAFATPDFSGSPVAATVVTNKATLATANTAMAANVRLFGLPQGVSYILAYIDSNGNGICDDWESMGYLCGRGRPESSAFIPVGVEYSTGNLGDTDEIEIYIDDADTNQNCLPDAYEWAVAAPAARANGTWMTDESGNTKSDEAKCGIDYNPAVSTALKKQENSGSVTSGMAGKLLLTMAKPKVKALALGFDTPAEAVAAASLLDESATVVSITGISVAGTKVTVDYTTDVATMGATTAASSFYVITGDTLKLPLVVKTKANLADAWTATETDVTIPVGATSGSYTVDLGAGASAGFVTIELKQN